MSDNIFSIVETQIPLEDFSMNQIISLGLKTALKLNWIVGEIHDNGFIAYVGASISELDEQIKLNILGEVAFLQCQSVKESKDKLEINQQHIQQFTETLQDVKQYHEKEELDIYYKTLQHELSTTDSNPPEETTTSRLDTMSYLGIFIPKGGYFITPIVIIVNIVVFVIMCISGVHVFEPATADLLMWGANFRPMTLDGQPWRLFTATFLHIGVLHLLMNMYALMYIGILLEPILGRTRFGFAYVLAGIVASVTSIAIHDNTVSAGASGAIFGMYGVFLALLTTDFIEKESRKPLLISIGIFVGFNLFSGMKAGVDNAAHMGGLISGALIGYAFIPSLKKQEDKALYNKTMLAIAVILLSITAGYFYSMPNDYKKIESNLNEFAKYETKALKLYEFSDSATADEISNFIITIGLPDWDKCIRSIEQVNKLTISKEQQIRNKQLLHYCNLRIQSYKLINKAYTENTETYRPEIDSLNREIESIITALSK